MAVTISPHSAYGLSILNLAPALHMERGKVYAIVGEDDAPSAALLWRTLLDASEKERNAALVSAPGVAENLAQSGLQAEAHEAIRRKRIAVFETVPPARTAPPPKPAANLAHAQGLAQDLTHLERQTGRRAQLLVINGMETLFPALDEATLRFWRTHAEQEDRAVVLLFREHARSLSALRPMVHVVAGLVELKSRYGATTLGIFHWFHREGLLAGRSVAVRQGSQGALEVCEPQRGAQAANPLSSAPPATDEAQFIAMGSVFAPQEKAPSGWRITDDDLALVQALGEDAVAATFVLAFTHETDFDLLARSIFGLRQRGGPRVKILVREVGTRLRYNQETLAVRLGANLVVPAELSTARFLSLSTMVQGQVFPHSLPSSYEQALKTSMPEQERGYLPPAEFTRAVRAALAQSQVLGVQVALVRLPLAYGLLPLDALRYCSIKRAGDLCGADSSSVYLFLYACRENDVDATLKRLFTLPVGELFTSDDRLHSPRAIEDALRDYDSRGASGRFPELTGELAQLASAAGQAATGPSAVRSAPLESTGQGGQATRRLQDTAAFLSSAYAPPPPAVPAPLTLREPRTSMASVTSADEIAEGLAASDLSLTLSPHS
ncbi:cellulose biosynthesis protein BcsE [Hylemonella sp. W303a]|uniref:cellulose biosynthesis protein BcsE n=1 Tax=Hylemonella sp. W303a TaxID=3389873 RepID=UPI00396B4236